MRFCTSILRHCRAAMTPHQTRIACTPNLGARGGTSTACPADLSAPAETTKAPQETSTGSERVLDPPRQGTNLARLPRATLEAFLPEQQVGATQSRRRRVWPRRLQG